MKLEMTLQAARSLAERIKDRLAPACERIEIAGSVRRRAAIVGDIEIVAVPLERDQPVSLLERARVNQLEVLLARIVAEGKLAAVKNGPKYKQFVVATTDLRPKLDLFLATPANWGMIYCLRTGPWQFSRAAVTQRQKGGLLADGHRCKDGLLWRKWEGASRPEGAMREDGCWWVPVPVDTEQAFMAYLSCGWIEPHMRRAATPVYDPEKV